MTKITKERFLIQASQLAGMTIKDGASDKERDSLIDIYLNVLLFGYFQGCGHSEKTSGLKAKKYSIDILGAK